MGLAVRVQQVSAPDSSSTKREGEEFQRVPVRYANERLLYRMSRSTHGDVFVLKEAS